MYIVHNYQVTNRYYLFSKQSPKGAALKCVISTQLKVTTAIAVPTLGCPTHQQGSFGVPQAV